MSTKKFKPFLSHTVVIMGCDPEFFFKNKANEIVGAEKIIPPKGLTTGGGKIIIDGVQAEINPSPSTCRESLAYNISQIFNHLANQLKTHPDITVDFSQNVKLKKEELDSLSEENKKFGCAPSYNIYPSKLNLAAVDATKMLQRGAGGHIHLSLANGGKYSSLLHEQATLIVSLLDVLLGNTFVLLDRDPGNVTRRKLYGRAGEYRLPKHGLEYRTLSNFWLRHMTLMSLAFGLARTATQIALEDFIPINGYESQHLAQEVLDNVKLSQVKRAINKNDFDLALENFKAIDFVFNTLGSSDSYPISIHTLANFYTVVDNVQKKSIEHYFKQNSFKHWQNLDNLHQKGAGYFLNTTK